jgi:hypothetical protein
MKKLFLLCIIAGLALFPVKMVAQEEAGAPSATWTFPVVYNLDEKVSWYFDLAGTTFAADEDIYLWAWSPSEPDAGNWGNSSEFAKLIYVKDKTWRMELTPIAYFSKTMDEIKGSAGFWMRLKDKTGTKQSDVIEFKIPDISAFVQSGKTVGTYPEKFIVTTPIAILFNANTVAGFENVSGVHLHSGANSWTNTIEYHAWETEGCEPQSACYTQCVNMGNGIWRKDMIPYEYYLVEEDYPLENIMGLFVGTDWSATIPDFTLYAADVPIPPPPALSFFPTNVSKNDLMNIKRTNNVKFSTPLKYEITGAGKTINGNFSGNDAEQNLYIHIQKEFGNTVTSLRIIIRDANGNEISNSEKQLTVAD